jgi:hypothetical protein
LPDKALLSDLLGEMKKDTIMTDSVFFCVFGFVILALNRGNC